MGKGKLKKCLLISVMMCVTALSIAVVSLLRVLCGRLLGHKGETIPRITICAMLLFVHLFVAELPFFQRDEFFNQIVSPVKSSHVIPGSLLQSWLSVIQSCFLLPSAGKQKLLQYYLQWENVSSLGHLESSFCWTE